MSTQLVMTTWSMQIRYVSIDYLILSTLHRVICEGWPLKKIEVRDELLSFQRSTPCYSNSTSEWGHSTHTELEGCLIMRRVQGNVYWPQMKTQLKDYISRCDTCLAFRETPGKESLKQHEFPARLWSKVGIDLCEVHGQTLLVVVDYYSNFIEV